MARRADRVLGEHALAATQTLQRQYEAFIRKAPEQWMWAHRKWD